MPESSIDILRGTLDMLILKLLEREGEMHGYGISIALETATEDVLSVEEGSLYPALHRMEEHGWIDARWGKSENNRRAKFYRLTRRGRRQLRVEAGAWDRYSAAVARIMEPS